MSDKLKVYNHLKHIGPLTPREAMTLYGCYRLAARVHDLRCDGIDIDTTMIEDVDRFGEPCRYASYSLKGGTT